MSHQHIRAWQAFLQRLAVFTDFATSSAEDLEQFTLTAAAMEHVCGLQAPIPRAVLKKFVQEAQVGAQLQNQALFC